MSSSSESSFTRNVRRFARDVREIFLDFLRWDEEDETAAQAANISAIEDPSSSSVMLPAGGWKLVQRKRKPTSIDFPATLYAEDELAEILTFDLKVDNLNPQKALLNRIMRVTFDSPTPFGMDATWDGKPLSQEESATVTPLPTLSWSVIWHKATSGSQWILWF